MELSLDEMVRIERESLQPFQQNSLANYFSSLLLHKTNDDNTCQKRSLLIKVLVFEYSQVLWIVRRISEKNSKN